MARLYCPAPLACATALDLPAGAARHAQVLRLQPGDALTLFNGEGGEFEATVERMGRSDVAVRIGAFHATEREAPRQVHLAVGMPANDRMDWLVEKATELGVASIQPLLTERSVLRLSGERAARKQAHWQAIAVAACEQSGRNRVPTIAPVQELARWCASPGLPAARFALSLTPEALPLAQRAAAAAAAPVLLVSGPEGGLSLAEQALLTAQAFAAVSLGPRVLRAETAPLAALAALTLDCSLNPDPSP